MSVREVRLVVENWRTEYSEERPVGALNQTPPAAYPARVALEQEKAA
jgi:transposase InsO family protein